MGTIAVKNVDERLFRRVKALASLEGKTVGEEVNAALAMWVSQHTGNPELLERWEELEEQAAVNNRVFEKMRSKLYADHPGEFAVISSGSLKGTFKSAKEAYHEAAKARGAQGIVVHLTDEGMKQRVVELGWSALGEAFS